MFARLKTPAPFSARRRRGQTPIIVGLTGSIAMGKSTAATIMRRLGLPVFDSDASSRALTQTNGAALPAIAKAFPETVDNGVLDRKALAQRVFGNPRDLAVLEAIVHPLVRAQRNTFVHAAARRRARIVVFDIPLLFETGAQVECDAVFVVSAPAFLQRQRVLARPGMTPDLFASILLRQMPDGEKRAHADAVIPSGLGKALTLRRIKKALKLI